MKMNSENKFFRFIGIFVISFVSILILNALIVVLTDPFYHYHKPWGKLPVILDSAVYQTPGAAKNLEYKDAIVGTSMTENFHTSWFDDELGWKTMKLSYSGANTDDLHAILPQVFAGDRKVEHIIMDVNEFQLNVPKDMSYVNRPDYLYDDSIWNDRDYLLNLSVAHRGIGLLLDSIKGVGDNVDVAYTWEEEELFGAKIALRIARESRMKLMNMTNIERDSLEEQLAVCDANLSNILPFIEQNPDTEFIVFFPPYSMLYWEQKILAESLEDVLEIYKHTVRTLLTYDNVRVFWFQDEREIMTNLDNYRDICHHHPKYNRYIFECIRDGKGCLTETDVDRAFENLYSFVKDFDYSVYWTD